MRILQNGNIKYSFQKAVRLFFYGIAAAVAMVILMGIMNLIFLGIGLFIYSDMEDYYINGGEVMEALTLEEDGYVLSDEMAQKLESKDQWAMLLDGEGQEIWSIRKPEELQDSYTQADIARMSKWYLKGYPVHLRVWEDKTMVVGMQRDTQWKYTLEMPISWMDFVKKVWFYFVLINFILVMILAFLFAGRFIKRREQARIEWIAGISHDIRTPLSVVMGYADTLERNGELSEEARQQAAVIRHQSLVMKELIAYLNLTSQLEYSMQPLRKEEVRPAEVLRSIVAAFLNDNQEKNLEIVLDIAQDAEQLTVWADRQLMIRVFRNLIGNSLKYSGQEEAVSIQISLWREKRKCYIRYEDKGVGYSEEVLRGLRSRKKGNATQNIRGLGIVKKIVLAHRGKISFGNSEEGGSYCLIVLGRMCMS